MTGGIVDLRDCAESNRFYGGRAGRKVGIVIDGEPWIAKFPRTTKDLKGKHLPSYTSSPVSEYIGSHIYASLGIPAHETMLGYFQGKIVCACKDFCYPDKELYEFRELKNSTPDDSTGFSGTPSDGEAIFLSDVLASIEIVGVLRSTPGVLDRFWDMFVVDAFIKNPDRNNGNWGLLKTKGGGFELAPVYDCGSGLFSKRSASFARERLGDPRLIEQDAFGTNVSCYRLATEDDPRGKAIHPFDYMMKSDNHDLAAAIIRFANRIDMDAIGAIVDSVPEEAFGTIIMDEGARESHKVLLRTRYEEGILPALEHASGIASSPAARYNMAKEVARAESKGIDSGFAKEARNARR